MAGEQDGMRDECLRQYCPMGLATASSVAIQARCCNFGVAPLFRRTAHPGPLCALRLLRGVFPNSDKDSRVLHEGLCGRNTNFDKNNFVTQRLRGDFTFQLQLSLSFWMRSWLPRLPLDQLLTSKLWSEATSVAILTGRDLEWCRQTFWSRACF